MNTSWSSASQVLLLPFICLFSSFRTAADVLGFVFLAGLVFFVPKMPNCTLSLHLLPPGPSSPTLDQLAHSLFQSLAQSELIIIV